MGYCILLVKIKKEKRKIYDISRFTKAGQDGEAGTFHLCRRLEV